MSPNAPKTTWVDLPNTLLEHIFVLVCTSPSGTITPCSTLPLVNRRWRTTYVSSPLLWRTIRLDWAAALTPDYDSYPWGFDEDYLGCPLPPPPVPTFGHVSKWLLARASLVQRLEFTSCHAAGPALDLALAPLASNAPNLLDVSLLGLRGRADDALAALCHATALRGLVLRWDQPAEGRTAPLRVSATALASLSTLVTLERLSLDVDTILGSTAVSVDLKAWSALTNLTALRLAGRMESAVAAPEALGTLRTLRRLELSNVRLPQFSPSMVAALGNVTYLGLTSVLAAKPRRKSGFPLFQALGGLRSLRHLAVTSAGQDADLPASALAVPGLRVLDLSECCLLGLWLPPASALAAAAAAGNSAPPTFPALSTLQELHLTDVGVEEHPPRALGSRQPALTALTWRQVHFAAPRHRHWEHGGACEMAAYMEPALIKLKSLRMEYSGLTQERLAAVALPVHFATAVTELSLTGNRLGGRSGAGLIEDVLEGMKQLRRMSLANCGLRRVPASALAAVPTLEDLDLRDNPRLVVEEGGKEAAALLRVPVVKRNDRAAALAAVAPRVPVGDGDMSLAAGV
jgi:hypothetical protein